MSIEHIETAPLSYMILDTERQEFVVHKAHTAWSTERAAKQVFAVLAHDLAKSRKGEEQLKIADCPRYKIVCVNAEQFKEE